MTESNHIAAGTTENIGLLPDFCDVRIVFMTVLIVEVLALVLCLATPSSRAAFWDHLALVSMLMQWIALINAALLCRARQRLNHLSTRLSMMISFLLMMSVSLIVGLVSTWLNWVLALDPETSPLGADFLLRIVLLSAVIYVLLLRYFFIQHQWRQQLHAQAIAEIQALRARIRPHFLFNSMNTIASLISFKPRQAEKAIEDLAELFRASLMEANAHTLGDEIAVTKAYVDIEQLRLGERLEVVWQIEEFLESEEIPSLSLQPLVENAIYHGIEPLTGGGRIDIAAFREGEHLVLSVSNPISDNSVMAHKKGNQMAQQNIRQRLNLVYGDAAEFLTNETKHSYSVILRIPLERVL